MKNRIIYLANKEKNIMHLLEYVFFSKGDYEIKTFSTSEELCKNLTYKPDIVVLGNSLAKSGTLNELNEYDRKLPVIILCNSQEQKDTDLLKKGNYQYINQSGFFVDKIVESVELALQ